MLLRIEWQLNLRAVSPHSSTIAPFCTIMTAAVFVVPVNSRARRRPASLHPSGRPRSHSLPGHRASAATATAATKQRRKRRRKVIGYLYDAAPPLSRLVAVLSGGFRTELAATPGSAAERELR